ncbi:MAG: ribosome recycling factor [Patescibacteria group bacterium]|nr:ribosome recycling factor [Patescibacteria group bacterium]
MNDSSAINARMQFVIDELVSDLGSFRTGRVTSALVENIVCPAYGGTQNLKVQELATITVQDARTLVISPWDKSIIGDIKKGILESNLGMNPVIDGDLIRISFPPLTSEDREKYVKLLHTRLESAKVAIRQVRGDFMKEIKQAFENKELSEDQRFAKEKELQNITDRFTAKIEEIGRLKEQDLLQI